MKHILMTFAVIVALSFIPARAETDGDCIYTLITVSGEHLTCRAGRMYEGDEYIASDNRHFRITTVDDETCTAIAEPVSSVPVFSILAAAEEKSGKSDGRRLICMYSTHSDESYVPSDGESSLWEGAGIYDVGHALKDALEENGIDVVYSEESFLPHDAGAYSRSASTAKELLQKSPDALFDVHRDAIPAEEYETEIEGDEISKIRLFVGRSNANSAANMAFAKAIKSAADEKYPGLIKDIYMGKGNYNQELYPRALLLEMGTHEIDKELVKDSTTYLADVVTEVLYGETALAESEKQAETTGAGKGILWVIVIAVIAAVIYALASTGRLKGLAGRISRSLKELTANRK